MLFIYSFKDKIGGNKLINGGITLMKGSGKDVDYGNITIYIIGGICLVLVLILGIIVFVVCRRRK